jgi:hypothetical protein
MTQDRQK